MSQIARPASDPRGPERHPPSFPLGMQALWMLTPFTKETGATRGIRGSTPLALVARRSWASDIVCHGAPVAILGE